MEATMKTSHGRRGTIGGWQAGLLVACCLALPGCKPAAWTPPAGTLDERFQATLDHIRAENSLPGAVAAYALPDGTVATFATGVADIEAGTAMTRESRLLAGSIGKSFVAAVALELVKEGKLGLDGKVEQWLGDRPWFPRLPNGRDITLRHLLTHSSGLSDHYQDPDLAAVITAGRAAGDPDWHITPDQAVEVIVNNPPLFAPGKGFAYTDTGYILVGLIIEKAAGAPYYDELRRRFLEPLKLGMTSPADRRDVAGLVPGYIGKANPMGLPAKTVVNGLMAFSPASEWTGGGLVSNPADLVRWARELYEGRAMPYHYLDELLASVPWGDAKDVRYGLGVIVSETLQGTRYGHSGWFPGYVSDVRYYPAQRVAVAIQTNTDEDRATGVWVTQLAGVVLAGAATAAAPAR
jgi:D-alanyl-D-alanine carboxypeptidase